MSVEKLLLQYRKNILYNNDPLNWIGPEDGTAIATSLRSSSVVAYDVLTHKCVRKFGLGYAITDITNIVIATPRSDGGGVNKWWYEFYDVDTNTLLGTVKDELGASTFVDGSALGSASTGIYIKIVWKSGTATPNNGDTINVTTDIDAPLAARIPGESFTSGEIILALADSGSTYYAESVSDQAMRYGGYRHTSTGTDRLPYATITAAIAALGAAFIYAHILDSATYDERDITPNGADEVVQAASGENPMHTCGIGQRETRSPVLFGLLNNTLAVYFNENGSDAAAGTWQAPKQTPAGALGALAGIKLVAEYGGTGATVNGGVFTQAILFPATAGVVLEADYGYLPIIRNGTVADTINIAAANQQVRGFYLYNLTTSGFVVDFNSFVTGVYDCTIRGGGSCIQAVGAAGAYIIQDNIVFDALLWGINFTPGADSRLERNIVHDCGDDGINITWGILAAYVNDNQSYNNGANGIEMDVAASTPAGELHHNLCYGNTGDGYRFQGPATNYGWTIDGNISSGNTGYGYNNIGGVPVVILTRCNSYNNTAGEIGGIITHTAFNGNDGADATLVNPQFMDETNNNFALRRASTITKIAVTEIDLGPRLTLFSVENNDIIVNGLTFNGRDQYFLGIYKEGGGDYEGLTLKFCELYGLQGIAVDDYCNGLVNPTETVFEGVILRDNGGGVKFWAGSNTIDGLLSYNNIEDNLGTLYDTAIVRASIYGAENGIYVGTTGYGTSIIDAIINGNSVYGINSIVVVIPTYSCVTDAVTSTVDLSAVTNFTSNPLFISVDAGEENFKIKTTEGGYSIDSDCKAAASDGGDIGAWNIDRDVASWVMRQYEFAFNPNNVREGILEKGLVRWTNGLAALDLYATGFKNIFELRWDAPQVVSEELRLKIKFFTQQIKNRLFATPDAYRVFRLHLEKDDFIDTGSTGVIDATAKTLTDAAKSFVEYQHQGFHVGVKLETGTATGTIAAAGKTLTVAPSPAWTTDEHVGRFIYRGYNYYYVMSNTADVLTLSDPDGTLVNAAGIDWAIEQYFKILTTDIDGVMSLEDSDGLLVDGTYEWYIDFMEVVLQRAGISWRQPQFDTDRDYSKTGFQLRLEER